ncbi:hypothetical protein CNMCM8980_008765 [Aspergillus fumigatiaffinis]|uniref:Uncharacterized protein n=1 Tax=Aspergillus fumigatiaffinis TaxID=340414 RepID=A0A8H4M4E5_9EURO|nr:hypothetical protein CNMCM6805_002489 [Aspergillus fumigatiaffinis]KAF4246266.1 hypothetical protein CNMCM8980_008765 [Aspergillus fumigatiaffinis]
MLSVPKPDWYFGFHIHNDIRSPRKTDKGQSHAVFSLTELNLLEETEALYSCPRMSLMKTRVHSVGTGFEDSDSNELDEYEYTTTEDEDYEPGSEEEDDSSDGSDGSLEDEEDLDSETYEELEPSRGRKYKKSDVDVAEGGDTDGTDASDLETGTSRRKFEDYKLTCYPWAVVEVKKPGASPQDTEECYYQVANGSSACVALLRGLSDSPVHDYHHPVVAMTFVGRDVRVFLTYAEPLNGDDDILYRMRCIWKGRLDVLWNALQLRRMLDTIQYWALQKYGTHIDGDIKRLLRKLRVKSNPSTPSSFRQAEGQGHSRTSPSPLANKRGNRSARPASDDVKRPSTLETLLEKLGAYSLTVEFGSPPRSPPRRSNRK